MAKLPDRIGHSNRTPRLIPPINVSDLKTYPLKKRHSKVRVSDFAKPWRRGGSFSLLLSSPSGHSGRQNAACRGQRDRAGPSQGPAGDCRHRRPCDQGRSHADSRRLDGAGHVTAVAMNGAGIIHDFELALMGHTSEEVDDEIDEGRFGMAEETGRILNEAIAEGHRNGQGLGEAIGRYINRSKGQISQPCHEHSGHRRQTRHSRHGSCRHRHGHHPHASVGRWGGDRRHARCWIFGAWQRWSPGWKAACT